MITEQIKLVLALKGFEVDTYSIEEINPEWKFISNLTYDDGSGCDHSSLSNKSLEQAELNLLKKLKKEGILK
jgi:hypothetical protein